MGIYGRPNTSASAVGFPAVPNTSGNDGTITRFGWKAQNKSLQIFAGEAYNVEMGVTNEIVSERTRPDVRVARSTDSRRQHSLRPDGQRDVERRRAIRNVHAISGSTYTGPVESIDSARGESLPANRMRIVPYAVVQNRGIFGGCAQQCSGKSLL